MNSIQAEITQRVLELMAYIHSVTKSESEYESLLSQAAMELLDEAVLFEDNNMDEGIYGRSMIEDLLDDQGRLKEVVDEIDDDDDDLWDDNDLSWLDDWDYEDQLDDNDDDDNNDTEYRQQADGRVL